MEEYTDADIMPLGQAVRETAKRFKGSISDVPTLEAQLLLARAIGKNKEYIMAHPEHIPTLEQWRHFQQMSARRAEYEPVAYILGESEFFALPFKVDKRALVPRPSTESLVETVLEMYPEDSALKTLDIGAGTGVISICLAKYRPNWRITALDISQSALDLAGENAASHQVSSRIDFVLGDLFPDSDEKFDLIVGNPPYVPSNRKGLSPDIIRYEPELGLYGGEDGLDLIRKIIEKAPERLLPGGGLVLEMGYMHMEEVSRLLKETGMFKTIRVVKDLMGIDRVMAAKG